MNVGEQLEAHLGNLPSPLLSPLLLTYSILVALFHHVSLNWHFICQVAGAYGMRHQGTGSMADSVKCVVAPFT